MYNKIVVVGHLGNDPEGKNTDDGFVCNFSVAVNLPKKAEGEAPRPPQKLHEGRGDKPMWIQVAAWGDLGETCHKYLTKGRKVLVEGRPEYDRKTGGPKIFKRQDGTLGAAFEMTAFIVEFLDDAPKDEKVGEDE